METTVLKEKTVFLPWTHLARDKTRYMITIQIFDRLGII